MQVISVTFPKKIILTVAVNAKHVVSADLTEILLDLDTINGEVVGTTAADKTDKIEATKLAIENAIEAAGVDVPALTVFADYADYVTDAVIAAAITFDAATNTATLLNAEAAPLNLVMPASIRGAKIEHIGDGFNDRYGKAAGKLTGLILPAGIKTLGSVIFRDNAISGTLIIPESCTSIGTYAFYGNLISSLILNEGLLTIASLTFRQNLFTSLVFPNSLTTIGQAAFQSNSISEVTFGSGLLQIDPYAFHYSPIIKITIGSGVAIQNGTPYETMGTYGLAFETLYNSNGKLAGTYEYAAGSWSKTA